MIRTQVSLDPEEYDLAKKEASAMGISIAEFVRRAIRQALPCPEQGVWTRFVGMVESGDSHSSQNLDDIVYGTKD